MREARGTEFLIGFLGMLKKEDRMFVLPRFQISADAKGFRFSAVSANQSRLPFVSSFGAESGIERSTAFFRPD